MVSLVSLAAGAVHKLVLLAHEVLDDPLQLWRQVPLCSIELEVLHVSRELVKVNRLHRQLPRLLGQALLGKLSLLLLFRRYNSLLVLTHLLLQYLVGDL